MRRCTYPLTGKAVVDRIFTDLAVIDVSDAALIVREIVPEMTFDELQAQTGATLALDAAWRPLIAPLPALENSPD